MKKFLFVLILNLLVLAGCVKKQYVVQLPAGVNLESLDKKQVKLLQRQVKEQVEEEERVIAEAEQQKKWKKKLSLYCPGGGFVETKISPLLGKESFWLPTGVFSPPIRRQVYVLRAKNLERGPINIEVTDWGMQVENLCPGGSITLIKSLEGSELGSVGIQVSSNTYTLQFKYTASAMNGGSRFGYVESQNAVLWWSGWQNRQDATWPIQLSDRTGSFF